jgi:hypothetical protein
LILGNQLFLPQKYFLRQVDVSVSEQHTIAVCRADHDDKGSMFFEGEDYSRMRRDAVSFGQEFMMI